MSTSDVMTVDGGLKGPSATTQLVRLHMSAPPDFVLRRENYFLDLRVTPRALNSRAGYPDLWGPHRFERLGDMFLLPPEHDLHVRGDSSGPFSSIVCEIDAATFVRWLGKEVHWTSQRLQAGLDISNISIRQLMRRLAEEARTLNPQSERISELIVEQIVLELGRYLDAMTDMPAKGGLAAWRLRLIDERIKEDGEPPTLSELSALCNVSVRQLTRAFRVSRGYTIGEYLLQNRIENAKRLLRGDGSIKAVADELGFCSISSFAFAFRRATGVAPRQFRCRVLQGGERPPTPGGPGAQNTKSRP